MASSPAAEVLADPILRDVPVVAGFKVLARVVLYAKIGQGGMGVVYRGRHCVLDVDMAVKVLKPSLVDEDARFAQRFLREAQVAAHVTHQNVVRLYDARQEHGLHCLAMEFVDGESVRARVQRKGALPAAEALAILAGAAAGLAEAHRAGLVHRDIKPDNLLVARDGRVKVADLGLVKRDTGELSQSLGSGIMGTPQYMAPEQWDTPDVTAAADVWALGATLWFLLVGKHAIEATTIAAIARRAQQGLPSLRAARPDLRPEVVALFERCVAADPAARFADARELVAALRPLVDADERVLADPEAGIGGSQPQLVTPPPRAALASIRATLASDPAVDDRRSEARTLPSTDAAMEEEQDDGEGQVAMERHVVAPAAPGAPTAATAGIGFLLVALGALGVAIAGGTAIWAMAVGAREVGDGVRLASLGGHVLGGLLLAIGWGATSLRGHGGVGGLFGGLALAAGQLLTLAIGGGETEALLRDLVATAGVAACLFLHLGTLDGLGFDGSRLAAMLGLGGYGGTLFSFLQKWALTPWLWVALAWTGAIGLTLFGVALAVAAVAHWRST